MSFKPDYIGADAMRAAWLAGFVPPAAPLRPVTALVAGSSVEMIALKRRFPLPPEVEDQVVNRTQLAKALNASEPTLSKWLAKGMPCIQEGGNGRDYEFQLSDCYAWRMAVLEEDRAAKARADAAAAQLAMQFANDEAIDEAEARLSPREVREQSEAQLIRMRAAEARGDLVRTERVRTVFEGMLERVRVTLITMPDFAEREFGLTPAQVEVLERRCFGAMTDLRQMLEELITGGDVVELDRRAETRDA